MSAGAPDLFVVCKNCGAEVSPYITECPYCGNRLRKRAPKIDRNGRIADKGGGRGEGPSLGRLRRGEIPGIRPDQHPYAAVLLVILGLIGSLLWRTNVVHVEQLWVAGNPVGQWWRVFTAPEVYNNTGYAFVSLLVIAVYGVLIEHRHGPVVVAMLYLAGGVGGAALAGQASTNVVLGGNGAALALLAAWAIPDLIRWLRKRDFDGDLIGTGVLAVVTALMPLATTTASWVCDGVGLAAGLVLGYLLYKIHPV